MAPTNEVSLRGFRRRPPFWPFLAAGAVALQTFSLFIVGIATYAIPANDCSWAQCYFQMQKVYPYLGLGILVYVVGATLMGIAIFLHGRAPREPQRVRTAA